ncbi:MAG: DUF4167 domain-containing protein [Rhizobiales bacterium]|nr:DUF4167 domain-containing protein [Hyphomicrobiales bacterium]MBO6699892.1 DUF4167 domain-containing protein [Hyphomicrobiales bacterium]MBO6737430.1 DUF4167 domain-containing protein [Hyphomicrobiales bacterium]MBO6911496.1 DUF4167 domain-containing protein [Hyphomicrobiales bacterium]MBO6955204.1 DUF4167 domain-containing protein [Hyphomicrobiales bacterium]
MRPGQSNKRGRGRGGRKGPSPLSRSYESNGPDVKIRGTAQHIADKYINLARDAQSSGDTVLSEAYFQHAEHFYRIVAAAQQQMNQAVNVKRADDPIDTDDSDDRDGKDGFDPSDPDAPQPEAGANGSGQNRNENRRDRNRDDDDDGDRRSRRNRGRQRRGRGDDDRGDETRADARSEGSRRDDTGRDDNGLGGDRDTGRDGNGSDRPREDANAQAEPATVPADESGASDSSSSDGDERPRRAPRQRKARVEVADRFDGEETQASSPSEAESKPAPEAPKPVSLGDDVPPVQAASDDT